MVHGKHLGENSIGIKEMMVKFFKNLMTQNQVLQLAWLLVRWGALASFGTRFGKNTKRQYGTSGNSFVAVVEFGDKVKAKSMLAGGQSSDPNSPHFDDQAQRYADGEFKDVAYYREDVEKRAEKTYHPGEKK